ncbi:MAG: low molecular weight protein arginine phosphatase [Candidatus Omnitrophota bacterium]
MDFKKITTILIVCTGNSCRSVMAEGFLTHMLENKKSISISSCGVAAFEGMMPTPETVNIMKEEGIDVAYHRARRMTDEILRDANLILVMANRHKNEIIERVPEAKDRVFLLREFDDSVQSIMDLDIADPIGMPLEHYRETLSIIKSSLEKFVKLL